MKLSRSEIFLLTIGIAMRIYLYFSVIHTSNYLFPDSYGYLTLSGNIFHRGVFSQQQAAPFVSDTQRTPGYPVFLGLLGNNTSLILLIQILLTAVSSFLIYKITKLVGNEKAGRISGWIYFLQPAPVAFACLILSESLFIFLFLLFVYLFLKIFKEYKNKFSHFILLSLVLTASVMVRPKGLYVFLLAVLFFIFKMKNENKFRFIRNLTALILIFSVVTVSWMYRNHRLIGRWTLSTIEYTNIIYGRLGGMLCFEKNLDFQKEENFLREANDYLANKIGPGNIYYYYSDLRTQETEVVSKQALSESYKYLFSHFPKYVHYSLICFRNLLIGIAQRTVEFLTNQKTFSFITGGIQMFCNLIMFLSFLFWLLKFPKWESVGIFLLLTIIYLTILATVAYADTRYRLPIDSLLVIFTGWFFTNNKLFRRISGNPECSGVNG